MNTSFVVDLGESTDCRIIKRRGEIGLVFDERMGGMGSREDVIKHLDLCVEEWQKRNPNLILTEIVDNVRRGSSLVTGGTTWNGSRFFKPVKKVNN